MFISEDDRRKLLIIQKSDQIKAECKHGTKISVIIGVVVMAAIILVLFAQNFPLIAIPLFMIGVIILAVGMNTVDNCLNRARKYSEEIEKLQK